MNTKQLLSLNKAKDMLAFLDIFAIIALTFLASVSGRFLLVMGIAGSNGYIGSVGFADLYKSRFVQLVLSKNPQLAEALAAASAHSLAHTAGITIMLGLDLCIFIFGFAKGRIYVDEFNQQRTLNLEPISKGMAYLSSAIGTIGFALTIVENGLTMDFGSLCQAIFGLIFSSISPFLLYHLTHYMKIVDGQSIDVVLVNVKRKFNEIMN